MSNKWKVSFIYTDAGIEPYSKETIEDLILDLEEDKEQVVITDIKVESCD